LDKIDGAGGKDTLVIADADGVLNGTLPSGISISNVEKIVVNTAGSLGAFAVAGSTGSAAVPAAAETRTITVSGTNAAATSTLSVTYGATTQNTAALDGTATDAEA